MTTYEMVRTKAEAAHRAAGELAVTSTVIKNKALLAMADALEAGAAKILAANAKDMEAGRANNMKESNDLYYVHCCTNLRKSITNKIVKRRFLRCLSENDELILSN